jgi:hypothetical protein
MDGLIKLAYSPHHFTRFVSPTLVTRVFRFLRICVSMRWLEGGLELVSQRLETYGVGVVVNELSVVPRCTDWFGVLISISLKNSR